MSAAKKRLIKELNWKTAMRYVRCELVSRFQYWFFQRVLRINSSVPWSVHWSSTVTEPEKISTSLKDVSRNLRPGYMPHQYISGYNGIMLGRNVWLGPGVNLVSVNHRMDDFSKYVEAPPIQIGDNCWLGANVVILPSVVLGAHTVVGANAVVTHSFPLGDQVLAGVPARIVKRLQPYGKPEQVL